MASTRNPLDHTLLLLLLTLVLQGLPISTTENESDFISETSHQITWGEEGVSTQDVYFDDSTPFNVTAVVGGRAKLECRVVNLGEKQDVTWIRRRDIHILSVGTHTYTSDERFKVVHPVGSDDWTLEIAPVTFRDEGVYECQVSSSPKISLPVLLAVETVKNGFLVANEVHGSDWERILIVTKQKNRLDDFSQINWFRDSVRLNYDSPRGGVSLEIEKTPVRTTSKILITAARAQDQGNYTCAPQYAGAASVMVYLVNGEEPAAVQTGSSMTVAVNQYLLDSVLLIMLILLLYQPT
ncbi:unnamed protein product, partial [Meganyctiphanes norvegica]